MYILLFLLFLPYFCYFMWLSLFNNLLMPSTYCCLKENFNVHNYCYILHIFNQLSFVFTVGSWSDLALNTGSISIRTTSGATDHHWSGIRSDQYLRFGTHVIHGLIYEKIVRMRGGGAWTEEFERPASFKSPVSEHFGFPVKYNNEGKRLVDKTVTVCRH